MREERHSREARYSCCNCLDCCLPFSLNLHSTTHNLYIHVCTFACFTCGLKHLQAYLHKMVVSLDFTRPVPCSRACSLCLLRLIPRMSRISIVLLYTVWFCGNVKVSVKCPWLSWHNKTNIYRKPATNLASKSRKIPCSFGEIPLLYTESHFFRKINSQSENRKLLFSVYTKRAFNSQSTRHIQLKIVYVW